MQLLNDRECETHCGGASALVLPPINLGVITPVNVGLATTLLSDGGMAMVDQDNTGKITTDYIKVLGGLGLGF